VDRKQASQSDSDDDDCTSSTPDDSLPDTSPKENVARPIKLGAPLAPATDEGKKSDLDVSKLDAEDLDLLSRMENEDPRTRCGRMIKSRTNVPWQNRANLSESWRKGLPTAMHGKSLNANGSMTSRTIANTRMSPRSPQSARVRNAVSWDCRNGQDAADQRAIPKFCPPEVEQEARQPVKDYKFSPKVAQKNSLERICAWPI